VFNNNRLRYGFDSIGGPWVAQYVAAYALTVAGYNLGAAQLLTIAGETSVSVGYALAGKYLAAVKSCCCHFVKMQTGAVQGFQN